MDNLSHQTPRRFESILYAHFDIVHGCQLRCIGCPNSTLQPKISKIDVDDFATCLENIDVREIHTLRLFNFGEPLLHPQLAECVEQIPKRAWRVSVVEISTNGQKVHWDNFTEMLKLQVVNRLVVSCDGDGSAKDYERLRPPSKWQKLIEFLERVRKLRDRWSPATQLMTRSVIADPHARHRWQSVLQPRGWTPSFRGWMSLPGAASNPSGRSIVVPDTHCFFMSQPEEFKTYLRQGEVALLYVDADGTVVPCCQHPRAGVLGNLKQETYNQIMNGKARRALFRALNTHRSSMPVCGRCDVGPPGSEGPSQHAITSVAQLDSPYRELVEDIRQIIESTLPPNAKVLIASKGDEDLLSLTNRTAWHFPQDQDGSYSGHHPENSAAAIALLERMREEGAEFLVLPATMFWWLSFYPEFIAHLTEHCPEVEHENACLIYRLTEIAPDAP